VLPPALLQGLKAAGAELKHLDGVTTFCEMAVPLVSRLAEALGVPGNTPEAVDNARDKVWVRVGWSDVFMAAADCAG
jgi:hypothetical protein